MSQPLRSLLALLLLVPAPSIGVLVAMAWLPGPTGQAIFGLLKVWILLLPLIHRRWIERRPWSWSPVRPGGRHRWGGMGFGLISGLAIGAAILLAHDFLGRAWIDPAEFREKARRIGFADRGLYWGLAAYWIILNSLLEEYVWRWWVFRRCEELLAGPLAVGASSLCFTLHHVLALRVQFGWPLTLLASAGVFLGGAIWSFAYLRYRSIWPGYLSHVLADLAVFGIGYRVLFG